MAKAEKLLAKLLNRPTEMRYEDVASILSELGWEEDRIVGSHHQWTKAGKRTLPIKVKNGKVGIASVGDLARRYEQDDL